MGRPREHDEPTRLALLDEAERLVTDHGVDALSVRGVADAAGVSTRAIYSLFGSKEGLLVGLAQRSFELIAQWVEEVPTTADPGRDLVEAAVRVFRRYAIEHPALFALAFRGVVPDLPLGSDYHEAARLAFKRLEQRVQRLADAGGLGPGWTVRTATIAFHSLSEGLAAVELRRVMAKDIDEQEWRRAFAALIAGFAMARPTGRRATSKAGRPARTAAATSGARAPTW